jgi:hypothetical protein
VFLQALISSDCCCFCLERIQDSSQPFLNVVAECSLPSSKRSSNTKLMQILKVKVALVLPRLKNITCDGLVVLTQALDTQINPKNQLLG